MQTPPQPPAQPSEKPAPYKSITRYDLATGRILGGGQVAFDATPEPGQGFIDGRYSPDTHYLDIDTDVVERRRLLTATLSSDSITLGQSVILAPLPIPCTVRVDGVGDVFVDDGELVVTPESIGSTDYRMVVDEVGYLRFSYFFEVMDP